MPIRIGQGLDVHAFGPGNHVMLGGVPIPHDQGLKAHSDGDVVLHALMDAMLGALALGDIGKHFPDTDEKWAGADSTVLLAQVNWMIEQQGYRLGNADITVVCEKPKIGPHALAMREHIAGCLKTDVGNISVKATTSEKLGFTGRAEGVAVSVVVLLKQHD